MCGTEIYCVSKTATANFYAPLKETFSQVRAAAVSALAKFGASSEDLLPSILVLLQRSMLDEDDEVRDRASFFHGVLGLRDRALASAYILNTLNIAPVSLERALQQYGQRVTERPFDIKTVPTIQVASPESALKSASQASGGAKAAKASEKTQQDVYGEQLAAIPQFANLGPLFKSSAPIELTEADTEYNVKCVKHTFSHYVVLQVGG